MDNSVESYPAKIVLYFIKNSCPDELKYTINSRYHKKIGLVISRFCAYSFFQLLELIHYLVITIFISTSLSDISNNSFPVSKNACSARPGATKTGWFY